jgi:hypothetical protein
MDERKADFVPCAGEEVDRFAGDKCFGHGLEASLLIRSWCAELRSCML